MFWKRENVVFSKTSGHYFHWKERKRSVTFENWRPISFLNVDAKIMSKVITTRIKTVLSNIIHHGQTGIVEGGYIDNGTLRSIFDLMDLTLEEKVRGLLPKSIWQSRMEPVLLRSSCSQVFNFGADSIHRRLKTFFFMKTSEVASI